MSNGFIPYVPVKQCLKFVTPVLWKRPLIGTDARIFSTRIRAVSSEAFTELFSTRGIAISIDGKGRWRDNVFIERLWKSVKYEDIYLKAYGSMAEVRKGLTEYFLSYNQKRWHQSLLASKS